MQIKAKMVSVIWYDAVCNSGWFTSPQLIEWCDVTEYKIQEVGWLVADNKDYIVLACGKKDSDEYNEEQWIGLHKIPKGCVKEIKDVDRFDDVKPNLRDRLGIK